MEAFKADVYWLSYKASKRGARLEAYLCVSSPLVVSLSFVFLRVSPLSLFSLSLSLSLSRSVFDGLQGAVGAMGPPAVDS